MTILAPKPGDRYRHRKTGHEYEVLHLGKFEWSLDPAVIYRRVDGEPDIWIRPLYEFTDARFEVIDPGSPEPRPRPRIFKYDLPPAKRSHLGLPRGSRLLHVGAQRDRVCLWFRVPQGDTDNVMHSILILPTGAEVPIPPGGPELQYLGTAQLRDGTVWHAFMESGREG